MEPKTKRFFLDSAECIDGGGGGVGEISLLSMHL
jgi:hypothetical protein